MGQKANPVALRLKTTNKNFTSCWYSDTYYSNLLKQELTAKTYLRELINQIHYPNPITSLSFTPKRAKVFMLYLNPAETRYIRNERFQLAPYNSLPRLNRKNPDSPLDDSNQQKLPSFVSILLGRRALPCTAPTDLERRNGALLLSMQHSFQGVAPTLLSTLLQNNGDGSNVWGRRLEMKLLVYYTLGSLTYQRMKGGQLVVQNDFELLYKVHRFLWFQGRSESCLRRMVNQRAIPGPLRDNRKLYKNTRDKPATPLRVWGGGERPYKDSLKARRNDRGNSIPYKKLLPQPSKTASRDASQGGVRTMLSLKNSSFSRSFMTYGKALKRSYSQETASQLINQAEATLLSTRPITLHNGKEYSNRDLLSSTKASTLVAQSLASQSDMSNKARMTREKELSRRGRQLRLAYMELTLSRSLQTSTALYLYRSTQEDQTAQFLAGEIAFYLERRVPFRRIKQVLMRDLQRDYIEGIRVRCSGRAGGRSKKAQRAKEDGFQWGQTSSHVFSSKLSFDSRSALTPLGKIGIKVWVCFK